MIDWLVVVDVQIAIKMEHVFVLLANSLPILINLEILTQSRNFQWSVSQFIDRMVLINQTIV